MTLQRVTPLPGHPALVLLGFLLLCWGAGFLGSLWTAESVQTWYPTLRKPAWTPPSWLFAPVWTTLYTLMAVAAWLVWRNGGAAAAPALRIFALQLVLNAAWSGLFFAMRQPGLAFGELVLLWAAILATTVAFWQHSAAAGALLLPYLAWVSFAGALNFAIWQLNREA